MPDQITLWEVVPHFSHLYGRAEVAPDHLSLHEIGTPTLCGRTINHQEHPPTQRTVSADTLPILRKHRTHCLTCIRQAERLLQEAQP